MGVNSYMFIPLYGDGYEIFVQFLRKDKIVSLDDVAVAYFILDRIPVGWNDNLHDLNFKYL